MLTVHAKGHALLKELGSNFAELRSGSSDNVTLPRLFLCYLFFHVFNNSRHNTGDLYKQLLPFMMSLLKDNYILFRSDAPMNY